MKIVITLASATLLLAGCSALAPQAAPAKTVTTTATQTVTAEPLPAKTVEVEVVTEVTPQACLDAISHAEDFGRLTAEFSGAVQPYPDMVMRAAEAGVDYDYEAIAGITAEMNSITSELESVSTQVTATVDAFNAAKAQCRATAP